MKADNQEHSIVLEPIGVFSCSRRYPYEAPRQGNLAQSDEIGVLRLRPQRNFEQALRELEGFERIWLIYGFDRNADWKPVVRPPRAGAPKVGVFASRSPYRPNPLGLSCVELLEIAGRELRVRGFDLLDGTPVYDIKPYLPYADSFPDARAGWTADLDRDAHIYEIRYSRRAREKIDWLREHADLHLQRFIEIQLREDPDDDSRKRIGTPEGADDRRRVLAFRTFRIDYLLPVVQDIGAVADSGERPNDAIEILDVRSGYDAALVLNNPDAADPYGDLEAHRRFRAAFDTAPGQENLQEK